MTAEEERTLLAQLEQSAQILLVRLGHANRYLWVGHFKGGHIYGDLHSGD